MFLSDVFLLHSLHFSFEPFCRWEEEAKERCDRERPAHGPYEIEEGERIAEALTDGGENKEHPNKPECAHIYHRRISVSLLWKHRAVVLFSNPNRSIRDLSNISNSTDSVC